MNHMAVRRIQVGPLERGVPRPTAQTRWDARLKGMRKDDSFFVANRGKSQLHYVRVVADQLGMSVTLTNDTQDDVRGVRVFCDKPIPEKRSATCKRKKTSK